MRVRTYGRGAILTECRGIVRNVTQVHRSTRDREDKAVVLATHTTDHHLETGKLEKKWHGFSEEVPTQTQGPDRRGHCPSGCGSIMKIMVSMWSCVPKSYSGCTVHGRVMIRNGLTLPKPMTVPGSLTFGSAANLNYGSRSPRSKRVEAINRS